MGVVLSRRCAILALLFAACVQNVVAVGPPSGKGAGGSGGAGGAGVAQGTGGEVEQGGGGFNPGCGSRKPSGKIQSCGMAGSGGSTGSESGSGGGGDGCTISVCDAQDHDWIAECDDQGCKCKVDGKKLCECKYATPHTMCDPGGNCCPGWPHP